MNVFVWQEIFVLCGGQYIRGQSQKHSRLSCGVAIIIPHNVTLDFTYLYI